MGSTAVRYLTQHMLTRPSTLECTHQAVVSDIIVHSYSVSTLYCYAYVVTKRRLK